MNKRLSSVSLAALYAVGVSACANLPRPALTEADLEATKARYVTADRWQARADVDGAIVQSWDALISDPQLASLMTEALENSPTLAISAQSVARAQALLRQSQSPLLPRLTGDTGLSAATDLDDIDLTPRANSTGLSASWEADIWGRIRETINGAELSLSETEALYEAARQALLAQVARAYVSLIEAQKLEAIERESLTALEDIRRIVATRYRLGFASQREEVQAEADLARAQDGVALAEARTRLRTRALELLLGRYPANRLSVPDAFPQILETVNAGTPASVLRRRPDIVAAELNVLGAVSDRNAEAKGQWPSLTLSGGFSAGATDLDDIGDFLDPANLIVSFGLRLSDTLFNNGLDAARLEALDAGTQQAIARYGQSVLAALGEVEGFLDDLRTLEERRPLVQTSADAARETLRLAELQYDEGAIDLTDVLQFRQRSLAAAQTLISFERQVLDTRIALYQAVGGAVAEPALP